MAEIISFPNKNSLEHLLGEQHVNIDAIEDWARRSLGNDKFMESLDMPNACVALINSGSITPDNLNTLPAVRQLFERMLTNNHPVFRDLRQHIADLLPAEQSADAQPEMDPVLLLPVKLRTILDEIHIRELPPLDGYSEPAEITFLDLYQTIDRVIFKRILRAYCDTYSVGYDDLLQ